jgi:threonine/homoserine/homoserine lactone efflux protein
VDAIVTAGWFTAVGFLTAQVARLYSPRVLRTAERVTGLVLVGLGVGAAADSA